MNAVLFVTNGHGETAIAQRIARELCAIRPNARCDHLALVGTRSGDPMNDVGPRKSMPSGGLIAMGNVRNLMRDLGAGLLGLTWAQARFLRAARGTYDAAVAVGDAYALAMTLLARTPTVFVGTAKSVDVAPYGRFEERVLARASACFVRDDATAAMLRRHGVRAEAANAIVDLVAARDDPNAAAVVDGFETALALFPGSRESAYDDAAFLLAVTRELARERRGIGVVLSVAPGLDAGRFADDARANGWSVGPAPHPSIPFTLGFDGREIVRAWDGPLGSLLPHATLILGQAGTANEAAAAAGVPIVAFERERDRKTPWYRRRQRGLLRDALVVVPGRLPEAVSAVRSLLDDEPRRRHMSEVGRARMGGPGGARRIAQGVAGLLAS